MDRTESRSLGNTPFEGCVGAEGLMRGCGNGGELRQTRCGRAELPGGVLNPEMRSLNLVMSYGNCTGNLSG